MEEKNVACRMYFANVIEENELGFHRETLWYGGSPENLGLLIIDVMKDWYEPNKADLDKSIVEYHEMLEDKENLTFEKIKGEGFNAGGMKIFVKITNDLTEMFNFIVYEICNIFGKNGETLESFESFSDFKEHFLSTYDMDEGIKGIFDGVNEITVSKALYLIDIKYNYTGRHFRNAEN
ncbi:MAG: hypothetical protein ACLSAO_00710 [Anaerovoracaceae bacterium]